MPVWCRGEAALTGKSLLAREGAINIPAACGGVAVLPGYAVLADTGGVYIVPSAEIEEIVATALPMQESEPGVLKQLRDGAKLGDVTGATSKIEAALAAQKHR
jgi:4-hydroxy-4-methyl-2-oxoglutarate aldolase